MHHAFQSLLRGNCRCRCLCGCPGILGPFREPTGEPATSAQPASAATESSSAAAGALTLGVAGVAVASAAQVGKRTARRSQVVRQATAVAEKVFTKMPASVKPGVVTGQALVDLLNYAKENEFAIPGVNVVSSSSVNACMEAAKKAGGPVMVTFSRGGGQFLAGKAADNTDDAACIAGTVAGALHVRQVAKLYGVPVILHTDHCQKSWLPWFDGLIEASEEYFEKNGEPLFSSHMLDLSEESLEDNISICKKYLERMAKINLLLEMELGVWLDLFSAKCVCVHWTLLDHVSCLFDWDDVSNCFSTYITLYIDIIG